MLELIAENLLSPILLAFFLGIVARLVRSDLEIPAPLYSSISIYLLLAIGLKGGVAISTTPLGELVLPVLTTILLGIITPSVAALILHLWLKLPLRDTCAIAAHYGSVSAVTYLAGMSFLEMQGIEVEGYTPALMAILEVPGIAVALLLYEIKRSSSGKSLSSAVHEVVFGKSLFLLIGGIIVGALSGAERFEPLKPLFVEPFKGILLIFLLALGLQCGDRLGDVRRAGIKLVAFGILVPIAHSTLGIVAGSLIGMSMGGAMILGILAGSSSYIAAPAAVRIAIPKASPALYLTCSLAITFPFNIIVGIPLYFRIAELVY